MKKIRAEVTEIIKVWNESTCQFFWQAVLVFEEPPNITLGEKEVIINERT